MFKGTEQGDKGKLSKFALVSSRSENMNEKIGSLKIDIQTVHSVLADTAHRRTAFGLI